MIKQLVHNGVIIPDPPSPTGLVLTIRGEERELTPKQEEMIMAWAKKKGTDYVKDAVFVANFFRDWSEALGLSEPLTPEEVDLSVCYARVDAERAAKEAMTKEERKVAAAERKAKREALKAKYGYAIVNGEKIELGNYMTEPSGIFMGRGEHPLRGRWKEGAKQQDVTLNLSPDAPRPEGDWGDIVWEPEALWVARWEDRLSGKLKYIWLSDAAPMKQDREADKFDQAHELEAKIEEVRAHIAKGLASEDRVERMLATACFLIDELCLRVGDEKDSDEADTVGATTLRPEHIRLGDAGEVEFKFLGKDSVEWHKTVALPPLVVENLEELVADARPSSTSSNGNGDGEAKAQLFPDITSRDVNDYLSQVLPGLSAKVFRTHHATMVVKESLYGSGVKRSDPEYVKWKALSDANLEAAILCNHTKKAPASFERSQQRYAERIAKAEERVERYRNQVKEYRAKLRRTKSQARKRIAAARSDETRAKAEEVQARKIERAEARVEKAKDRLQRARHSLGKIRAQKAVAWKKRTLNLNTSLKSYIDPRIPYRWGKKVGYDVLESYYPAALERKFAWVRVNDSDLGRGPRAARCRICMNDDLADVAELFAAVNAAHPDANLPEEPDAIAEAYLPWIERPWRDAVVAMVPKVGVVGFAVLGPVRERPVEGRRKPELLMDVFGVMHPEHADEDCARALAHQVKVRYLAFLARHPKDTYRLAPEDGAPWRQWSPDFWEAMDLPEGGEDEGDGDD
ncbi:MAG: DNA topoisomerase I [Anaerolineae bacterium]